ncbi:MAG TPA: DUF2155 domain-containing protein [Acetobacteraceae bacterium]|nr:DUF2155 domain-containing protein [Acetobacteraceae bacterium]
MMRLAGGLLAAVLLLYPGLASAQAPAPAPPPVPAPPSPLVPSTPPPATPAPAPVWLPKTVARLRVLNKVDGMARSLAVPAGQSATVGSLKILVRACVVRPPDAPADAAAYLHVTRTSGTAASPVFHGWMLATAPSVSMMQDPVYDIAVVGCQ